MCLSGLQVPLLPVIKGSQGRNSRQEPEAGTESEEACLLTCSGLPSLFIPTQSRTSDVGVALPTLITNE